MTEVKAQDHLIIKSVTLEESSRQQFLALRRSSVSSVAHQGTETSRKRPREIPSESQPSLVTAPSMLEDSLRGSSYNPLAKDSERAHQISLFQWTSL